jgi:hypothetical protein
LWSGAHGVALARHFREAEALSNAQIGDRLGRSPATIKAYFNDPTGEKARAVKSRYQEVCRGWGAYTQARNGKGDAYAYCKACHPGAIEPRWTPEHVRAQAPDGSARHPTVPGAHSGGPVRSIDDPLADAEGVGVEAGAQSGTRAAAEDMDQGPGVAGQLPARVGEGAKIEAGDRGVCVEVRGARDRSGAGRSAGRRVLPRGSPCS